MMKQLIKKLVELRNLFIYKKWDFLAKINQTKLNTDPKADFVVSIATYPKRAHLLPAVIEALNQQTQLPQKWIVVLTEEEWPELQLPKYLNKLIQRGLEIVWVKNNSFAVKKLLPVMQKYPDLGVITFDDELIYGKNVIKRLMERALIDKYSIIGHVGKKLIQKNGELKMHYRANEEANQFTPSEQIYFLGGSGTYYPPKALDERAFNLDYIHKIVPGRGSDIWFWAAALANNTKQICLGSKTDLSLYFAIPSNNKTKPKDLPGLYTMEKRFQMAIDYFEVREKLIKLLPNK